MMELEELIDRIEGLTGPDRDWELEMYLDWYVMWGPHSEWENNGGGYERNKITGELRQFGLWSKAETAYTTSIDGAVAFVNRMLPGWSWECRASGTGDKGQATVWNPLKAPGHNDEQRAYNCQTPAIALVLATLRALGRKP